MKRIEVKLNLPAVAPLLDAIKAAADSLADGLAAPLRLDDLDAEFAAAWQAELVEAQNGDVRALLALFDREFFSSGIVAFDETNAEAVVRACSALRLRLRAGPLAGQTDEELESGAVEPERLEPPVARAFMAYVFLATLQDLILRHLDSTILGSR